jgi:adenylate kinase
MSRRHNCFFSGGPGSGKGTQAEKLSSEFHLPHISAGELLRQEIQRKSEYSDLISRVLSEGGIGKARLTHYWLSVLIVPAEITIDILKDEILRQAAAHSKSLVIDGFPRNQDNLSWWLKKMTDVCRVNQLIHLDCSNDELRRRLTQRRRADDTEQIIETRIKNHFVASEPVLKYFEGKGLVSRINGEQTKEEVYRQLRERLLPFLQ